MSSIVQMLSKLIISQCMKSISIVPFSLVCSITCITFMSHRMGMVFYQIQTHLRIRPLLQIHVRLQPANFVALLETVKTYFPSLVLVNITLFLVSKHIANTCTPVYKYIELHITTHLTAPPNIMWFRKKNEPSTRVFLCSLKLRRRCSLRYIGKTKLISAELLLLSRCKVLC